MSFDPNAAAAPDSGIFGLPHTPAEARVVLIPVPFEATTSYGGGTQDGPAAILEASRQVDLFDLETGKPYERGIALLPAAPELHAWNEEAKAAARPIIEAGGVGSDAGRARALDRVNGLCEQMNAVVYAESKKWIEAGKLTGVVGGDHSTPFGCIRACAEKHPGLGILHVDAHADLRVAYEGFTWSHASIMHNVVTRLPGVAKLVQVGIRDFCEEEHAQIEASRGRIVTHYDATWQTARQGGTSFATLAQGAVEALPAEVYVSFDIDGLDPSLCPHTGTPVPGGLSFAEACGLIRAIARSGRRIVGFDLNEVAPDPEGKSEWDANVGARLLYKMIGWALRSETGGR